MKRITKILLLTFIFTMLISSTCLATDTYPTSKKYNQYLTYTQSSSTMVVQFSSDNPITIHSAIATSTNIGNIPSHSINVIYSGTDIEINMYKDGSFTSGSTNSGVVENQSYSIAVKYGYSKISSSTFNVTDSSGTVLVSANATPVAPEPEPEPEPDIPDIPAISLPSSDYSKNYYFMYENSSGNTCLAIFSSNNEIIFDAFADNNSAYIDFTFTSPMNYSNYILRDNEWVILENANYDESGTKNVNIGYTTILSSSFDIKNEDGSIFFPLTPTEEVEKLGAEIMKAMATITIVAVSCLALLISLQVLWKLLRIYLA